MCTVLSEEVYTLQKTENYKCKPVVVTGYTQKTIKKYACRLKILIYS